MLKIKKYNHYFGANRIIMYKLQLIPILIIGYFKHSDFLYRTKICIMIVQLLKVSIQVL